LLADCDVTGGEGQCLRVLVVAFAEVHGNVSDVNGAGGCEGLGKSQGH